MPSDERLDRALQAVDEAAEAFHSSVSRAVDEVRAELTSRSEPTDAERRRASELGPLAAGRIDPARWAGVLTEPETLAPEAARSLREALDALEQVENAESDAHVVRVEAGGDLYQTMNAALADFGRAFGAARTAGLISTERFKEDVHAGLVDDFPPARWNRGERGIAPPLVVQIQGADLRPGGIAPLLDGRQKVVFLVEGASPPAPLVRLVTPGVLVLQTDDPEVLDRIATAEGPAVAALFPPDSGAALFLHDPAGGDELADRLTVETAPDPSTIRPVGTWTVAQQVEELAQLRAITGSVATAEGLSTEGAAEASDDVEPADRLAAWLLRQANLKDVNGGP